MKLSFAITCDNAFTDNVGRLNIIQTFDSINNRDFPFTYPRIVVVTKFTKDSTDNENNYHHIVSIVNKSTRKELAKAEVKIDSQKKYLQFVSEFVGLTFEDPDVFEIKLTLNGNSYKSIEFNVVEKK